MMRCGPGLWTLADKRDRRGPTQSRAYGSRPGAPRKFVKSSKSLMIVEAEGLGAERIVDDIALYS